MEQRSVSPTPEQKPHRLTTVTTVSKYVVLVLFILLPFLGGYVGYNLATKKVSMTQEADVRQENRISLREEEAQRSETASRRADLQAEQEAEAADDEAEAEDEDEIDLDYVRQFVDISEYSFASFEEFEDMLTGSGDRFYRTDVKVALRQFGYEDLSNLPAFHSGRDIEDCGEELEVRVAAKAEQRYLLPEQRPVFAGSGIGMGCSMFTTGKQTVVTIFSDPSRPHQEFRNYFTINDNGELEYPQMLNKGLPVSRIGDINIGITEGSLYRYDVAMDEMVLIYKYRPRSRYNVLNRSGSWINFCVSQCESFRLISQERNSILIGVQRAEERYAWPSESYTVEMIEINFNDNLTEYTNRMIYRERDDVFIRWSRPRGQPQYRTDLTDEPDVVGQQ